MQFQKIPLGAGATTPDARTSPADVPDTHVLAAAAHLPNTDQQPSRVLLVLEGTAANTATIQQWVLDEALPGVDLPAPSARKWYKVGATKVLTVGTLLEDKAYPGKVYFQITVAPAAAATLLVGFGTGEPRA